MLNTIALKARTLLLSRKLEREMQEEMRAHLERATERLIARGMDYNEARREAVREFGNVGYLQEEGRNARGSGWVAAAIADARFAVRHFSKSPANTLVMIGVLGFGIAISTGLFSFQRSAATAPPVAVPENDELVRIRGFSTTPFDTPERRFNAEEIQEFEALDAIFTDVASWTVATVNAEPVTESPGPGSLDAVFVSPGYFRVLGVQPLIGTWLPTDESGDGTAPQTAVISHLAWAGMFGQRPDILGQSVRVNGATFTIVGVSPRRFRGPDYAANDPVIWLGSGDRSLVLPPVDGPAEMFEAAALIRPGLAHSAATEAVTAITSRVGPPADEVDRPGTDVVPMLAMNSSRDFEEDTIFIVLVFGLIGLVVLLVTCTNVSALLAGRAMSRRREIAVRLSLGAERPRIIRQLLTESILLALCASLLALGLVTGFMRSLTLWGPSNLGFEPAVDWTAALFAFGLAITVGVAFGVSPAFHATRFSLSDALKDSTSSIASARGSLQRKLVVAQIACTQPLMVGLVAMIMLIATDMNERRPTATAEQVVTLSLAFTDRPGQTYFGADSSGNQELATRMRNIQQRLEQEPGVAAALLEPGISSSLDEVTVPAEYRVSGGATQLTEMSIRFVDPRLFAATGIPLIAGRTFTESDPSLALEPEQGAKLIINRDLADQLWPDVNPIGRRLDARIGPEGERQEVEVIGVVDDPGRQGVLVGGNDIGYMYMKPELAGSSSRLLIRTTAPAEQLLPAIRLAALEAAPPGSAVREIITHASIQREAQRTFFIATAAFSGGGVLALLISAVGLYAVVAYAVSQRRGEIAVRMAVGAHRRNIMGRFIRDGFWLSLLGAALGLPVAVIGLRYVGSLEEIPPLPLVPVLVVTVLGTTFVALCATWLPAVRAAAVRPALTLRRE